MRRLLVAFLAATGVLLVVAPTAFAAYGLKELKVSATSEDGTPALEAGSHPFALTTEFAIETRTFSGEEEGKPVQLEVPEAETRDFSFTLPPGFVGNLNSVPRCSSADFAVIDKAVAQPACDSATALGVVGVDASQAPVNPAKEPPGPNRLLYVPLYNLTPPPGVAAEFGFLIFNVPVTVDVNVSQKPPYNVVATLHNISQFALVFGSKVTIWGDPADPVHDPIRGHCLDAINSVGKTVSLDNDCTLSGSHPPFLTLPRSCSGPLEASATVTSWDGQQGGKSAVVNPSQMNGCEALGFGPSSVAIAPTTSSTETPSGLGVDIEVDDKGLNSALERALSDIRSIRTVLPPGMTINPSAGEGLEACTKAEFESISATNRGCPEAAKVGNVRVTSPLVDEPLGGAVYIAQPENPLTPEAENQFNSLLAAYLVVRNENLGIAVGQAGKIEADAVTGQLTASFNEIPQFPLATVHVDFREGSRAPLATPHLCGSYASAAIFTPWSGTSPLTVSPEFLLSSGIGAGPCPAAGLPPFAPSLTAGSLNNRAGAFSPFLVRVQRADGEQEVTRLSAILPPGVTGKIANLSTCSDGAIAAAKGRSGRQEQLSPSCPQSSEIGNVTAGAGVGPSLTWVTGKAYLAGPFGNDPLSIVVVTPAVAGPFDLGTVVTREGLNLNPSTGEVEVDGAGSDPIPRILQGIPVRLRDLRVNTDRPGFTLNPTNCSEESTRATLFGGGSIENFSTFDLSSAAVSQRYQASNCASLAFKPKLTLKLSGGTRRSDHPALRSVLLPRAGDANIGRAVVVLPHSEFIDQNHINNPCTRVQFAANACPKGSVLGHARAFTPLLAQPLIGPVYFRSNGGERELPDVVADLKGQFHIVLVGFVDSVKERIRTTFATVPDAPVNKFVLNFNGGRKGVLVNSANLCAAKRHVRLNLSGQNGRAYDTNPVLQVTSCKKKKKAKHSR